MEELRIDDADGEAYDRQSFLDEYGDFSKWNNARLYYHPTQRNAPKLQLSAIPTLLPSQPSYASSIETEKEERSRGERNFRAHPDIPGLFLVPGPDKILADGILRALENVKWTRSGKRHVYSCGWEWDNKGGGRLVGWNSPSAGVLEAIRQLLPPSVDAARSNFNQIIFTRYTMPPSLPLLTFVLYHLLPSTAAAFWL